MRRALMAIGQAALIAGLIGLVRRRHLGGIELYLVSGEVRRIPERDPTVAELVKNAEAILSAR